MKSRRFVACFVFGLILAAGACSTTGKLPTGPGSLVVTNVSLTPGSGPAGTEARLAWTASPDRVRVTITSNAGPNPGSDFGADSSVIVTPQFDTTYTLEFTDPVTGAKATATRFFDVK